MQPSSLQEVWITVRLKGYARCDADLDTLALEVARRCEANEVNIGLFPCTASDVVEIEEEAAIYGNEDPLGITSFPTTY